MLNKKTFEFLKWLKEFNDKKFFELYKPLYLKIKKDFEWFIDFVIFETSKFDDSVVWLESKKCIFRIYKDMRFPRNRAEPYKTNLWAYISNWWRKSEDAWYYIHIENNNSFFSWWIYRPNSEKSNKIRNNIYKNRDDFKKIIKDKDLIKEFWEIIEYSWSLKKIPKNFKPNHPSIKYLKYKDWLITKKLSNQEVLSQDFWKKIIRYIKIAKKINNFLK